MRSKHFRALSVLAVLALVAMQQGIAGFSFAVAATGGPTLVLSSTSATTTNAASIPITAVFSEPVTGFASTTIVATGASVTDFSGTGANYSFSLHPTADGTITVQIPADVASSTASSTGSQASNTLTFTSTRTAPVITEVTGVASTTTSTTPSYTFSSTAAGTIAFTGGCTASTTDALVGTTTLTFNALATGSHSCTLTLTDAAGNVSNSLPINFTIQTASATLPVISDIAAVSTGTTTESVTWTTDVGAASQVFYGTSQAYGSSTPLDASTTTAHTALLSNLLGSTLYHYQISATAASGTTATSSDRTFTTGVTTATTTATSTSPLLAVTGIDSLQTTAIADNTFPNGWKWVLHFTVPTAETFFQMKFADFTSNMSSLTIPIASNMRYFSPQSSNAATESAAILETGNNYGGQMTLNGDTSTSTPGRQIDVTIQMAIPTGTPTGVYSTIFGALSTTTAATTATTTATTTP